MKYTIEMTKNNVVVSKGETKFRNIYTLTNIFVSPAPNNTIGSLLKIMKKAKAYKPIKNVLITIPCRLATISKSAAIG